MKHNPMIYVGGDWYLVETDRDGKKWAVSEFYRISLKDAFSSMRKQMDEAHALGRK